MSSTARFASASFCASRARRTTFVLGPCCGSKNGLILGAAGQDLAADHQECGRDNLYGTGGAGGWHDYLRMFKAHTLLEFGRPDQRLASALFSVRFKTHQRRPPWPVAKACRGGWFKKRRCPSIGRGGAPVLPSIRAAQPC